MAYRIDPSPTGDGTQLLRYEREAAIVVVGCGGTGGFLADAACRLLLGRSARLYLVDPDRVEPHNVARQTFLCGIWKPVKGDLTYRVVAQSSRG
jgi:hypothetical protein